MNERTAIMGRMFMVFGLLLLLPFAILVQLFRINMIEGEGLRQLWSTQAIDYVPVSAQRGNVYDANGSLLATNSVVYQVAIDPKFPTLQPDQIQQVAATLAKHTNRTATDYLNRIRTAPERSRYVVLDRNVSVQAYEDIRELGIRAVILEEEYKRTYNFGTLAAHSLGYVNHRMDGMTGLESYYNDVLRGEDGLQQVRRDRANRIFAYVGAPRKTPVQGHSLHTTIDAFIQAILEEELKAGVTRHLAKYGTAIVMDPRTGAIKAMANYPTFDPNNPATIENENRRNYAVSDMIEPGSTFKLVTAIAAVEQGVVDFDELFVTPTNGQKLIHGQMMRDHDPLGTLNFVQTIAKSSNIATSEIAMRMTPQIFYQYARNMGFGTVSNIDLPNELPGRLQRPFEWSQVTLPWMSIGYEVQTTPLQLTQAYAAFANNGMMMRPYVVDKITDEFGRVVEKTKPVEVRKIARDETINKLLPVFQEVVSDSGTAIWASVDGLTIAGKTGTAQKFIDGRYRTNYRASFAGFFPVEDPKYVIVVILDEPRTSIYGGFTAGSVFKQTATRIAGLDNDIRRSISPDDNNYGHWALMPSVTGLTGEQASGILANQQISYRITGNGNRISSQTPEAGSPIQRNIRVDLQLGEISGDATPEGLVKVPDLQGLNMRQATTILAESGLDIQMIGSGTVYSQFPRAGEFMRPGREVTVRGRARSMQQVTTIAATN